ncbi:MAG TPA: phospholipase D-like domain-containing protein [Vicinamibacterales bacterium]|nr:phospholipase D-like domain-containing protein [Vicinamibacterales bacterium]
MKLIIQPEDGIAPILAAIKNAKKSVEIAIFRFDRKDVEAALKSAAASKGVTVTALIAFANRGGEVRLRNLEQRFLDAGIIVARTADDLIRYHNKYILIDRRTLYVLSFNFTHLDIDHSRGFAIVTTHKAWISEAMRLFKADSARTFYTKKSDTFVVSPSNSRKVLENFLKKAQKELLIYDPRISDKNMLRILNERAKAGVDIKVIGSVAGRSPVEVQGLKSGRLHTRTIIRDRRQAFIGSQSLRPLELDGRRELGLIVQDARTVKKIIDTFESDWDAEPIGPVKKPRKVKGVPTRKGRKEEKAEKAVQVLTQELDPLATTVKQAVRRAVAKAGEDVLHDKDMKATMKDVVKRAVKEAVKEAHEGSKDK